MGGGSNSGKGSLITVQGSMAGTGEYSGNITGIGSLTGTSANINNSTRSSLGAFSTIHMDNDVNLVWTSAIPEPASSVSLGLAGMLMLVRRRRALKN